MNEFRRTNITEAELKDMLKNGVTLYNKNDPRSMDYVRTFQRPRINILKLFLLFIFPLIIFCYMGLLFYKVNIKPVISIVLIIVLVITYLLFAGKYLIIEVVKIYQRFAPDHIRNRCRFEPSCSEYMILSLRKYGLFKGLKKGINRLKRCNIYDGGYDNP